MNPREPIYVQPIHDKIEFLPKHFNSTEYDTLSSLNLPMNESGTVLPQQTAAIPLGYRIIIPRGCIGVMKERRSIIQTTPFMVLAGILDCNTMSEDAELKTKPDVESLQKVSGDVSGTELSTVGRMHPEVILYIYNCGTQPLEYTKGKSIVQLFVQRVCESQLQILSSTEDSVTVPLRYSV